MTAQVDIVTGPVPADKIAEVGDVLQAAYEPYADLPGLPDMTDGLADDLARGQVIRAVADGTTVGLALWSGPEAGAAHLVQLAVAPAAAGQGLGGRLLDAVAAAARDAGATRLQLGTHAGMSAARRLYARDGWTETAQDGLRIFLEKPL